jgi:hypothetical protein
MRQQQLEGLVLAAIDRARAGHPVEDDRIEFKQAWPETSSARQLAGIVNRANGNDVIYIVGANESGDLFPLGSTDAADWWAQFSSKFDGVAPDLQNHINVPIDEGGSVTALQFGTDRAPYVVKVDRGGSPEREVPIRDGTRTRSATRSELLRMLLPQVSVPPALLLSASVNAEWYRGRDSGEENCYISGSVVVFLEQIAPSGAMLPNHEMTAIIEADGQSFSLAISPSQSNEGEVAPSMGVHVRRDGVMATGPGSFHFTASAVVSASHVDLLRNVEEWTLHLKFRVTGSPRAIQLDGLLSREREAAPYATEFQVQLGKWKLHSAADAVDDSPIELEVY